MKVVCKRHGMDLDPRKTRDGKNRLHCSKCDRFVFNKEIMMLEEREWKILQELNMMEKSLKRIWDLAFHAKMYRKMKKGLPEHGLGEMFVGVRVSKRSILGWRSSGQIW